MSKVTKTYQELVTFVNTLIFNVGEDKGRTKGQKKLFKIYEKFKVATDDYTELVQDLRLEHASVDDKKNLILDEKGGYTFTKEGSRAFNKAAKELAAKTAEFNVINVVNPDGLEIYPFLKDWVEGVTFIEETEEEL